LHDRPHAGGVGSRKEVKEMTRLLRVTALVMTLVLAGAWPATAAEPMRASLQGITVGFSADPGALAARCPAGSEWILRTAGSGQLSSEAYAGSVDYSTEHCSRVLAGTMPGHAVGKIAAGLLTLVTPGGDELYAAYEGTFVFNGDVAVAWRSDVHQSFAITGGTGVFAGASGNGSFPTVDNSGAVTMALNGALDVPN
jgi:hypothetical protein